MNNVLTRRQMVKRSAQAAAAITLSQSFGPLFAAPGSRGFKIGACDWSLGRNDPSCMQIAREIGLDGVQVSMGSVGDHMRMRQREVQQQYLKAARENNVEVASLALSETNNVPLFSEPRAAIWLLDSIEVCKALNVKVVLIACFAKGELSADDKPSIDRVVDLLKEIAPRAEKVGVLLGLENYMSAEANIGIMDRVGSPAVQVYYDVGNSTDKGYDIFNEIRLLGKRICEFHAKDAGNMLGKGRIDFKQVRAAMDDIDYRGWIQIEAAAPHSIVEDYRADLNYLRGIFPA
jgi:sugar phosphate isomerase/epimerase